MSGMRLLTAAKTIFENTGVGASILVGLLSLGIIWLGVWYIASEDAERTETSRYQDTANLARAFYISTNAWSGHCAAPPSGRRSRTS